MKYIIVLILTIIAYTNIWQYKSQLRTENHIEYIRNSTMIIEKVELGRLNLKELEV